MLAVMFSATMIALFFAVLYFVVRKAVGAGIIDADAERERRARQVAASTRPDADTGEFSNRLDKILPLDPRQ